MLAIVEFPQVVWEALEEFTVLLRTAAGSFCRVLMGLMVAHRKTVAGINREFVNTPDHSGLSRFLSRRGVVTLG